MVNTSIYCPKHKSQRLGAMVLYPKFAKANKIIINTGFMFCPKCKKGYEVKVIIK